MECGHLEERLALATCCHATRVMSILNQHCGGAWCRRSSIPINCQQVQCNIWKPASTQRVPKSTFTPRQLHIAFWLNQQQGAVSGTFSKYYKWTDLGRVKHSESMSSIYPMDWIIPLLVAGTITSHSIYFFRTHVTISVFTTANNAILCSPTQK